LSAFSRLAPARQALRACNLPKSARYIPAKTGTISRQTNYFAILSASRPFYYKYVLAFAQINLKIDERN